MQHNHGLEFHQTYLPLDNLYLLQLRMLTVTGFSQLMAIRLDLGENSSGGSSSDAAAGEGGDESHVDLCIVRYGDDGVLQMSPDFSSGKMPYKIDVKTGEKCGGCVGNLSKIQGDPVRLITIAFVTTKL